jgi:sporulation integral membrane protein YtvI
MTAFFQKRLGLPRVVSTGICVSMAFCLLVLLVLLAAAFFLRELRTLAGVLPDLGETARDGLSRLELWMLDLAVQTPESIRPMVQSNVTGFFSGGTKILNSILSWFLGLAGGILSHVPDGALGLGTAIISGFMISAKLPKIRQWLRKRIPREKLQPVFQTLQRIRQALGGWLFAQAKLAAVTWGLLSVGFWLLGISYPPLWALLVALVDAVPVLGTGTVLIPWALIALLQSRPLQALGLICIYGAAMLTRTILEPRLVGKHLGLDPLVTLVFFYVGYKFWGVPGMLLAPILATAAKSLTETAG